MRWSRDTAPAHLIADDLVESQLPGHVDDPLELPARDVAHPDVVHLPTLHQVVQRPQGLLQGGPIVPAVRLDGNYSIKSVLQPVTLGQHFLATIDAVHKNGHVRCITECSRHFEWQNSACNVHESESVCRVFAASQADP